MVGILQTDRRATQERAAGEERERRRLAAIPIASEDAAVVARYTGLSQGDATALLRQVACTEGLASLVERALAAWIRGSVPAQPSGGPRAASHDYVASFGAARPLASGPLL